MCILLPSHPLQRGGGAGMFAAVLPENEKQNALT